MMLYFWPQQYLEVFHNIMHDDRADKVDGMIIEGNFMVVLHKTRSVGTH